MPTTQHPRVNVRDPGPRKQTTGVGPCPPSLCPQPTPEECRPRAPRRGGMARGGTVPRPDRRAPIGGSTSPLLEGISLRVGWDGGQGDCSLHRLEISWSEPHGRGGENKALCSEMNYVRELTRPREPGATHGRGHATEAHANRGPQPWGIPEGLMAM